MMPQRFFTRIVLNILIRFMVSYVIVLATLTTGHTILNKKSGKRKKSDKG